MIETQKSTQDSNQVYDRCINALRNFTSLVAYFLFCFTTRNLVILQLMTMQLACN